MFEISNVLEAINEIRQCCQAVEQIEKKYNLEFEQQSKKIQKEKNDLVDEMLQKFDDYINDNFTVLKEALDKLEEELKSYKINQIMENKNFSYNYNSNSSLYYDMKNDGTNIEYENLHNQLNQLLIEINNYIEGLNSINFDELVPPKTYNANGETIEEQSINGTKKHNYDENLHNQVEIPNEVIDKLQKLFDKCENAKNIIDKMQQLYELEFNVDAFENYANNCAQTYLNELKNQEKMKIEQYYDSLFVLNKSKYITENFFIDLKEAGEKYEIDNLLVSNEYREAFNIGEVKICVAEEPKYLSYFKDSPVLSTYLDNGYLTTQVTLNLKEKGCILLNVSENDYSQETIDFVNQLIMQFLLSFPANRINFCLIDIDNKVDFSKFKILTKINNNILYDGIIRDDRQLENTIKDLEQTMYNINDDKLSYNNVNDIYEYNKRFDVNPQNVHLFVLANFPSGIRDDISNRILKIVQNGKKTGIFSIIINNSLCQLPYGYKPDEYNKFIDSIRNNSLVITKNKYFSLEGTNKNIFVPKNNFKVDNLSTIIDKIKEIDEHNPQKVVALSRMFDEIDREQGKIKPSEDFLDIPIGVRGGEIQNLLISTSSDAASHTVVIGGTGSGKSNLLHTIIMDTCYKYSPEDVNFYLVDFKGGVEFKFYEAQKNKDKQIPHIKLCGLTSDLEDGVAILKNLKIELKNREDTFRRCNVEDISQYVKKYQKLPRIFVIIDEIQELFEQDDRLGQIAIDILREFFKKGRAFGINILWASQNIPHVPGLKDRILSQIGNRISLRLNELDDALDIKIDPKIVRNLNRPEKGLGVINDIRFGNESVEFRVAYADTSENRKKYAEQIIDKWKHVTSKVAKQPLFIVGDDNDPSPLEFETIYNIVPNIDNIISKSDGHYNIQLGQDYVTGRPFTTSIKILSDKENILFVGHDVEILRDMMGYSLLSTIINHKYNLDWHQNCMKIYYVNGEMINPKNSSDLFNVLVRDFNDMISDISSFEKIKNSIKELYQLYKQRKKIIDEQNESPKFTPCFVLIHSLQRYIDLFNDNVLLNLSDSKEEKEEKSNNDDISEVINQFSGLSSFKSRNSNNSDEIYFSDAVKDLLIKGSNVGIHFIISMDNPTSISSIKNELNEFKYKIFTKGVNPNLIAQMLSDYKISNVLSNPKVALFSSFGEHSKIRVFRYDPNIDSSWYTHLQEKYKNFNK